MSEDSGKTFTPVGGGVHSDHHALWVNPKNPFQMAIGTDGSVFMSDDRGNDWRMLPALPVSQFHHVSYDMDRPYNVYGGLQDNGMWTGPSTTSSGAVHRAHHDRPRGRQRAIGQVEATARGAADRRRVEEETGGKIGDRPCRRY